VVGHSSPEQWELKNWLPESFYFLQVGPGLHLPLALFTMQTKKVMTKLIRIKTIILADLLSFDHLKKHLYHQSHLRVIMAFIRINTKILRCHLCILERVYSHHAKRGGDKEYIYALRIGAMD
jgi:hypothetical protein